MIHRAIAFLSFLSVCTASAVAAPSLEVSLRGAAQEDALSALTEDVETIDRTPAVPSNDLDMVHDLLMKAFGGTTALMSVLPSLMQNPTMLLQNTEVLSEIMPQSDVEIDEKLTEKVEVAEKTIETLFTSVMDMDTIGAMIPQMLPALVSTMGKDGKLDMSSIMQTVSTMGPQMGAMGAHLSQAAEELKASHALVDALSPLDDEERRAVFIAALQGFAVKFSEQMGMMNSSFDMLSQLTELPEIDASEMMESMSSLLSQMPAIQAIEA